MIITNDLYIAIDNIILEYIQLDSGAQYILIDVLFNWYNSMH